MSETPANPYEAVIADLEARKAQIEATIANLKALAAQGARSSHSITRLCAGESQGRS